MGKVSPSLRQTKALPTGRISLEEGGSVIATAILDQLLHHCNVVNIKGYICRLKEHTFNQKLFQLKGGENMTTLPA
jgi:DNA replication protein DnaC